MTSLQKLNKKLTEILNLTYNSWRFENGKWIENHLPQTNPIINLEDVLMAFQIVRKFHTTLDCSNKGYLTYSDDSNDIYKQADWILGKSLFEQKNKTIKFIIEVLK